jgi:tetratricopeptide (TPR) repeat protein
MRSALGPETARAWTDEGESRLGLGQALQALESFDRALELAPMHVPAQMGRGLALKGLRRLDDALAAFDRAIAARPDYVPALVNRAGILIQLGRASEALAACDRAIALQPDFAPAHCNRGLALNDLEGPLEALPCFERAIGVDPDFAAAHGNRAKALQALNRPREAVGAYQRVLALQPDAAQAHVNSSHTHLLLGDYEKGLPPYEWRKRLAVPLGNRSPHCPLWLGDADLEGKSLLLHWEQGLGDTIQFCRYARLARARGARVSLMVQRSLRRLMSTLKADVEVISDEQAPPRADLHCPLLSLPYAFRTRLETIPAEVPYLAAEQDRVLRWRERLRGPGFKVGINWQGNKQSPADRGRSFPLHLFQRIASIPGVRLISLQMGAGTEQLQTIPRGMAVESLGDAFNGGPDAFLDSAAVIENLDLVITSDTAVAHLAGALARPAWVALMHVPDWRWLMERADSPWYPTHRLYRQRRRGGWDEVFDAMHAHLVLRVI